MHRLQRALSGLVNRVDTPAPIVLLDVLQRNIDGRQGFAAEHELNLRPHVKTHKCVEIGRLQVKAGAVGVTAGNVGEAEVFAEAGGSGWTTKRPSTPSPTRWTTILTGSRSWSRWTVGPEGPGHRQMSRER